jgi:hypothetical protein
MGIIANEVPMFEIIGIIVGFPLQDFILYACIILGVLLLFIMCCGIGTAIKRLCFCHWLFATLIIFSTIFFVALGIAIMMISEQTKSDLTEQCNSSNSDSDFQKAVENLYSSADTFYCIATPTGCPCQVSHVVTGGDRTYITSPIETPFTVTNVQECRDFLQENYGEYVVDFDSTDEIVEYLDLFGKIEDSYSCSGICTIKPVYYFSDSTDGEPEKKCEDSIKNDVLDGIILPIGICYFIIGMMVLVVAIIQFGLC